MPIWFSINYVECKETPKTSKSTRIFRFLLTMWNVKFVKLRFQQGVATSFLLTMWNVKSILRLRDLIGSKEFSINYVECKEVQDGLFL